MLFYKQHFPVAPGTLLRAGRETSVLEQSFWPSEPGKKIQ